METDHPYEIAVMNPVTGEAAGYVPHHTPADVVRAIAASREAQRSWGEMAFRERAKAFIRFHDLIIKQQDELFDVIQSESGKSRRDAFTELFAIACAARYYAYHGERILRPQKRKAAIPPRDHTKVIHHPVGVVGIISPWNFPFILSMGDVIPALLAGNGVVLKPASLAPLSSLWGRKKLIECGLPEALFQIVTVPGRELGNALVDHVDFLMFTGSTNTGRQMAKRAAERLIPYSMELGGKNALLILPDANLKHAATVTIEGSYFNAGQVCINFERIYVHTEIYEAYKAKLLDQIRQIRLGSGDSYDYDMGSLSSEEQLDVMERHVKDAVSKGANLLYGGKPRPDLGQYFYEPTILEDVRPTMAAYAEETFGPLISLYRVNTIDEAIQLANDSPYGLYSGVCAGDLRQGEKVAAQLKAGSVCVNDGYMAWAAVDAPMGGFKESGVGRRHGSEGILKYTEAQTILINRTKFQISSMETPLALNKRLAKIMSLLIYLWRRVPFLR